jgi:hypothetical protein
MNTEKYTFEKWLTLLKFKKHTLIETYGYANHPMETENTYTIENTNRERIKLKESTYITLKEVICKNRDIY